MIRIQAIASRTLKEMIKDKRTLIIMIFAPILILTLMNIIFTSSEDTIFNIGVNSSVPSTISKSIEESDKIKIHHYDEDKNLKQTVADENLDAFITVDNEKINVLYNNEDPSITTGIKGILANNLNGLMIAQLKNGLSNKANSLPNYSVNNSYLYGNSKSSFFDKRLNVKSC